MPAHASSTIRPILDEAWVIDRIVVAWRPPVCGVEPESGKQLPAVGSVMGHRCHQANAAVPLLPAQRDHVLHYGIAQIVVADHHLGPLRELQPTSVGCRRGPERESVKVPATKHVDTHARTIGGSPDFVSLEGSRWVNFSACLSPPERDRRSPGDKVRQG
jgi:hypothetical protein